MATNLFAQFRRLSPDAPLLIGTVTAVSGSEAIVSLPTGGTVRARGEATLGGKVWVRDGVIEGDAPDLPITEITE